MLMKKTLTVLCALAAILLTSSCAQKTTMSSPYHKIVYEVSSTPDVNMDVRFIYPGRESVLSPGTGSYFSQECPGITAGWHAFISASVIQDPDYPIDAVVSIKIYMDDVEVAQTSGQNRAQLEYNVPE